VGERDMDNEQRLTPVCVPYVKLLGFNSSVMPVLINKYAVARRVAVSFRLDYFLLQAEIL